MDEYLKNYQKLLELQKQNNKEIEENNLLIEENLQKWNDEKEQEETIKLEIQKINEEYKNKKQDQKGKIRKKINIIIAIINIIILLVVAILTHPIFLLPTAYVLTVADGVLAIISILILDETKFIENKLNKDERIIELLEAKKKKEIKLSEINKTLSNLFGNIIKYRNKSKQLKEKKNYIEESLNELMRNFAQPILEEQLKKHQEEVETIQEHIEEKDNRKNKIKSRKP